MKTTKTIIFQAFLCLFYLGSSGNNYNHPFGARSSGISDASVTYADIWSADNNQAGLAYLKHFETGINYENRFLIQELSIKSLVIAVPSKSGVFGLSYSYYGYSNYNEDNIGFAYSKTLGKFFSLGIRFDYLYTHIAEKYGNKGCIAGEAGLRAQLIKNLIIGIHIFNPTYSKITNYNNEKIPTIFKSGIGYDFSGKVYLSVEVEKEINSEVKFKTGLEYSLTKNFFLRTGLSINPQQNSFGVGYYFKNIKIDLSYTTNPVLGMTSSASISLEL